jgi:predicted nucleic acid-binding Zn ribbon protein
MDLLNKVLQKIFSQNPGLKRGINDARMVEAWAPAVGETIAKHSKARQVKNKTMIVDVDHPIWKQELIANKTLALQKLNAKISEMMGEEPGKVWIEDLFLGNLSQARPQPKEQSGWSKRQK